MRIPHGSGPDTRRERAWGKTAPLLAAALLSAIASAALGCATPEQRHRWLTFFFDDVPPLHIEKSEAPPEVLAADDAVKRSRPPPRKLISSVHGPVADKQCQLCHENRFSRKLNGGAEELCWSCHQRQDFPGTVVHGPVAAGQCIGCHDPHRSEHPQLLVQPAASLCEYCHTPRNFARLDEHRAQQGEDCQHCHDPHASDIRYMLRRDSDAS
jgi:predicted CXXCH cytochrome family protein